MEAYWYCAHCNREVAPGCVTYSEMHEECGHPVEPIEPESVEDSIRARVAELESALATERAARAQAEGRYESAAEWARLERSRADKAEQERDEQRARAEAAEKRIAAFAGIIHPERIAPDREDLVDPPICAECGSEYTLCDYAEPTPECDDCAHGLLARVREALRPAAQEPTEDAAPMVPERPVCTTCGDTHTMRLGEDREVPCTHCPTPCERCRSGAYCATTPCVCECHQCDGKFESIEVEELFAEEVDRG